MPVYEYRCNSCHRKVSLFRHNFSAYAPACPHCGGELKRTFSTFAMHKTYKDVYDDILSDRNLTKGMLHNDPRALAEWNKRMTGGEKPPPDYEEMTGRMESGEWPAEQIEQKRKEVTGLSESSETEGD